MKTIDEALDYLYSFINYETNTGYIYNSLYYNVKRTISLLEKIGNPQKGIKFIHVAGTKGKGSVCMILSKILKELGYKTGLFLSPHIERINERISIDETEISNEDFIKYLNRLKPAIEEFPRDNRPTTFEILTAMAVLYFKDNGVDFAILETGMGGRYDSTNFVKPLASVITSISYDHMDKLGDSIEKIAGEKAGIIKENTPVIVGIQRYPVYEIFSKQANSLNAPYYEVENSCEYLIKSVHINKTRFNVRIYDTCIRGLKTSLIGKHQVENILTALLTLKVIGFFPSKRTINRSIRNLNFKTRFEIIKKKKHLYVLDSAHNEESSKRLVEALKDYFKDKKVFSVVGIVKGKDTSGIIKHIASISEKIIVTEPITHKELDTQEVYRKARANKDDTILIRNIYEAIKKAEELADRSGIILITGSFYTTSPARDYLTEVK